MKCSRDKYPSRVYFYALLALRVLGMFKIEPIYPNIFPGPKNFYALIPL